ncbi:MAG: hypothetical protein N3B21_03055 [Clostridia bacterium]|nr:hypothetical protein [Clostridia bacterium]
MFKFLKRNERKANFDRKILRKNDISLLTLDERWNSLFANTEKTPEIVASENKIMELLKEQSRFIEESKENSALKKDLMGKIITLTTEVFDKNNEAAKKEMQECEKEIKRINERAGVLQEGLDNIPDLIKEANLELLEHTVNQVYFKIRANQKRVAELEHLIEETRTKLKEYIDEKESLSEDYTEIYSWFHDLLGGEELEKLDKEFFGGQP